MSNLHELAWLDATAQAELVRSGKVTPLELVDAAIERVERVNPQINAVITTMFDEARAAAQTDLPHGPFRGVPFLLKDLLASYKGVRMSCGSNYLKDFIPNLDSELVSRYKRAGLIVTGKTNTPEFGIMPTTEPTLYGPTRNPWDPSLTAGGSSGGSAAAVAGGLVPMAHGGDGGGSIRIPASCCGVFGLKPTRARNPLGPHFGDMFSGLITEHALTRSVRDSAALLDATSGPAPGDPYCAPAPVRPFSSEVGADPGKLRIALITAPPVDVPVHPDCINAVEDVARLCESLGHEVEPATFAGVNGQMLSDAFMTIWAAGNVWTVDTFSFAVGRKHEQHELEDSTHFLLEMGKRRSGAEYLMAVQILQVYGRRIAAMFERFDVLLTPTLGEPSAPLGHFDSPPEEPLRGMQRSASFVPFTPIFNGTGQPAMSIPLHWNAAGLPIGTQFVAPFGDEATLFRLASQLEEARPWRDRRPGISA